MSKTPIIYCADVLARHGDNYVLIERLKNTPGLALPGGKQEKGKKELLSETACREFFEETGLTLTIEGVLGTFAEEERDPRGRYVATVFLGVATGTPRNEPGATIVKILPQSKIEAIKSSFVFDFEEVWDAYTAYLSRS